MNTLGATLVLITAVTTSSPPPVEELANSVALHEQISNFFAANPACLPVGMGMAYLYQVGLANTLASACLLARALAEQR